MTADDPSGQADSSTVAACALYDSTIDWEAVKLTEILARLNGVSTPVFGLSWDPPTSDIAVARRVIAHLEDRRVLFSNHDVEFIPHCTDSLTKIREFLTETIAAGGTAAEFVASLRAMRAACQQFQTYIDQHTAGVSYVGELPWANLFYEQLGRFRSTVGYNIAIISVAYGIDVESPLDKTLPAQDADD